MITAQEVRQEVENAFVDAKVEKVLGPQLKRVGRYIKCRIENIKAGYQSAKCGTGDPAWDDLMKHSEFSEACEVIVIDVPERLFPENREFLEKLGYEVKELSDWTLLKVYCDR